MAKILNIDNDVKLNLNNVQNGNEMKNAIDTKLKIAQQSWGNTLTFAIKGYDQTCLVFVNGKIYGAIWFPSSTPTLVSTGLSSANLTLTKSSWNELTLTSSSSATITVYYL